MSLHEKVMLSRGKPAYVVTADEWQQIKTHLLRFMQAHRRPTLYAVQYSNVWDCVKIGRCSDVNERLRAIGVGHTYGPRLTATFPGYDHPERRVHKQLMEIQ